MGSEVTDKKTTKLTLTRLTNKPKENAFYCFFLSLSTVAVLFGIYVCWIPQINAECQSKIIDVWQQPFLSISFSLSLILCSFFLLTIWFFRFDWFSSTLFSYVHNRFSLEFFCLLSGSLLRTNWVCLNRKKEDCHLKPDGIVNKAIYKYKRNLTERRLNKSQLKLV